MARVTADELKTLCIKADREALCELVSALTEKERIALAEDALTIAQEIEKSWGPDDERRGNAKQTSRKNLIGIRKLMNAEDYPDWRCPRWTASLMVAALCDRRVLEDPYKFGLGWVRSDLTFMPQRLLQVLADRRPPWLARWLDKEWRQEFPVPNWYVERGLIRCAALPKNDSPEYFERMASDRQILTNSNETSTDSQIVVFRNLRQVVDADPHLLEHDVWRLFDIDSSAFRHYLKSWGRFFVVLSQEGKLDRKRLLSKSLEGMLLPLSPTTVNGIGKFHEMLEPEIDERVQLLQSYLDLLAVQHPTVVGHGLTALEILQKAKKLDAVACLASLPNAFLVDRKSQPVKALKLAAQLIKQEAECRPAAVNAIIPALRHENSDVQETAIRMLESLADVFDKDAAETLSQLSEKIALSNRMRARTLLELIGYSEAKPPETTTAEPQHSTELELSSDLLSKFSSALQNATRLDESLKFLDDNSAPVVLPIAKSTIPRRDPTRRVYPVSSLDELIGLVSKVIERVDDVIDLERILDGISRFYRERPNDYEKRVSPLRKRIMKKIESQDDFLDQAAGIGLTQLFTQWLELPSIEQTAMGARWNGCHWYQMRGWFLRERILGVRWRVEEFSTANPSQRDEAPLPVLALPTHSDGWLDPQTLVKRLNDNYVKHHTSPCQYDLAQAILRLTPDGRQPALDSLDEPDYYNGNTPLRHALGGDCELRNLGGWGIQTLFVASVRCRQVSLGEMNYQPEFPVAGAFFGENEIVNVKGAVTNDPTVPFSIAETAWSYQPFATNIFDPNVPSHWVHSWEAITNPMDTQASCIAGHLSHLFDPESTWSYEACRLALVASSNDRAETRLLATDALIESIERVLVEPSQLGLALANCIAKIKLNRLSDVFGEVAKASTIHQWVVFESLSKCVETLSVLPKNSHFLLGPMLEAAIAVGADLSPTLKEKLSAIEGKSKLGKLATSLQKLSPIMSWEEPIKKQILAATMQRAERWQAIWSCN